MTPTSRSDNRRTIERAVLERVRDSRYRPVPVRELVRLLDVEGASPSDLRAVVGDMIRDGRLLRVSGRRVVPSGPAGSVVGIVERRQDGRAVVGPSDGGDPIEIAERDLATAREGDTVAVRRTVDASRRRRARGVVVEVLARERGGRLGVLARRGRRWEVRPFEKDADVLNVSADMRLGAGPGDAVRFETVGTSEAARVVEVIGPVDAPGIDVEVVCRRHGLRVEFPSDVAAEADALDVDGARREVGRRERFDAPPPVTIDGETARDFDDAVAVSARPAGGWRLHVHIADVAWYVRTGSAIDREAAARGTSTYFPDRVVPMLPPRLSDDLCSLRPDVDRLVQTLVVDIDRTGRVRKHRVADGVIRSAARLTYDQVARALEHPRGRHGIAQPILDMLVEADRLRQALEARRRRRGSVDFDLPEPLIQVDMEGVMTGVEVRPRNDAHRMIEAFMLVANETVAERLESRDLPCLYRIHEVPDPTRIETLRAFVSGFGARWDIDPEQVEPSDLRDLLEGFDGRPEYPVVAQVALRSMKQARYAVDNVGHFGLAASTYAHFTSPIRRYPDLVVHRAVRASRRGGRKDDLAVEPLPEVAGACSVLERNAEAAERELLEWKKIAFVRDRVGDAFDGLVVGVAPFGLFVQLTENLIEGLVHVERLGPWWFDYDEGRMALRAREGGVVYKLGDRLRVRIDRVDVALRRVDLSLDESSRPRDERARSKSKGSRRGQATRGSRRSREGSGRGRRRR